MYLVLPKTLPSPHDIPSNLPLFFLAGPILGGGDWQYRMTKLLMAELPNSIIVNPSRYSHEHPLYQYRVDGKKDAFPRQTDWERHFLRQAGGNCETGCIIFWLAAESKRTPRNDGQPYARDTAGEVGEWRAHLMHDKTLRVAMGADPDYPGLSVVERNFELALGPSFTIYRTMEEVVTQARKLAHPNLSFTARTFT